MRIISMVKATYLCMKFDFAFVLLSSDFGCYIHICAELTVRIFDTVGRQHGLDF